MALGVPGLKHSYVLLIVFQALKAALMKYCQEGMLIPFPKERKHAENVSSWNGLENTSEGLSHPLHDNFLETLKEVRRAIRDNTVNKF